MNPSQIIQEAIDQLKPLSGKGVIGVDKKWLNKTIVRLEEAQLFSSRVILPGSLANTPEGTQMSPRDELCSCPEGAISAKCPIHGIAVNG